MLYIVIAIILFSFNNVLWKKNLKGSNVFFLVTYRAFFTSSFALLIAFFFYSETALYVDDFIKITSGSALGALGLFCMLTVIKSKSLQWIGIYNLVGIAFTAIYLWVFEKIDISKTLIGVGITVVGFIFYVFSSLNSNIKITLKHHLILLVMVLCFTLSSLIHWENLVNEIPPVFIIANQELVVFILGFTIAFYKRDDFKIHTLLKNQFHAVLVMGGVIFFALVCSFMGLKIVNPLISGLVFLVNPLTTILFSAIFFKESISIKNWLSILIISLGAFIIYLQTLQ